MSQRAAPSDASAIFRLRMLATAAGFQGSDAYTCTLGQVLCVGEMDCDWEMRIVPLETDETTKVIVLAIVSMVNEMCHQLLIVGCVWVLMNAPEAP